MREYMIIEREGTYKIKERTLCAWWPSRLTAWFVMSSPGGMDYNGSDLTWETFREAKEFLVRQMAADNEHATKWRSVINVNENTPVKCIEAASE